MSRAYRILIVEDEEIELSALTMMLKYNRQDIQEIRTAVNGIQALEVYREFLPDIVFMDINLPGINGLDVIRQIRLLPGTPYFVIISAHSQFAYAQEAMRLDVQDFLVKPIRLEDINRVLDGLVQQINQSRSRKERAQYQQAKIDAIRPVLESDCVLSIASMRSNTPIATIFDFMQIPVVSGFVFTLRGQDTGSPLLREIKSRMQNMGICCIGEMISEVCVCVALSGETIRPAQVQEIMGHLSYTLSTSGRHCQIGVGSVAGCADDLRRSYEQAIAASRDAAITGVPLAFYSGHDLPEQNALAYITENSLKIVQSIRAGKAEAVASQLQTFFTSFHLSASFRWVQEVAYWLYIMVMGHFPEQTDGLQPISSEHIFATQDIAALRGILSNSFISLIHQQGRDAELQSNQIVTGAIRIVKSRFQEDLTLDSVAEELNVSLFYLSKLFRKHTGTNFTEHLTQVRVDYAKKLLAAGEMSVKEVAYAAGFNSQSYFSKIFKKYTGIAPSEFKDQPAEKG